MYDVAQYIKPKREDWDNGCGGTEQADMEALRYERTRSPVGNEIICAYTRAQALDDGEQVDITETAREEGFKFPVFMTRGAFGAAVEAGGEWQADADGGEVLALPFGQDTRGRLHDVLFILLHRAKGCGGARIPLTVSVFGYDGSERARDVDLLAVCGPMDIDDARPAITIMLPDED